MGTGNGTAEQSSSPVIRESNQVCPLDVAFKLTALFSLDSICPLIPFLPSLHAYYPRPTLQVLDRKPCTRYLAS